MQKFPWWATLALVLMLVTSTGCGGKAVDKAVDKGPEKSGTTPVTAGKATPENGVATTSQSGDSQDGKNAVAAGVPMPAGANNGPAPIPTKVDDAVQKRVAGFSDKVKQLAGKQAGGLAEKNDLKQLGLAFHNYHDTMGHFPAVNGNGTKDAAHPGLSWRVYLLPYMEEAVLFQQFKLDEAWDSEHNKPLIAKMPKLFGANAEGKTQIHVLTGNGAAFKENLGVKISDALDGASNTLMAVAGGPSTAEIWTKPGGLAFDPQEPLKCLGDIGDSFLVLLMDGSVRKLSKTIRPETFAFLAQPADGNVLGDLDESPLPAGKAPQVAKIHDPVTPLLPASSQLDLSYIPKDAFAAIVVHPRRIFEHSVVRGVRKLFPADALDFNGGMLPPGASEGLSEVSQFSGVLGIAPQNLDEVVVLFDKEIVQAMMAGPGGGIPPMGAIVRNSAPLDVDQIVTTLIGKSQATEIQTHEGVSLVVSTNEKAAFAFITDSQFLVGQVDFVKKMISAREQSTATSGLTSRLASSGNRLIVLAVDATPVKATIKQLAKDLPGIVSIFTAYIVGTKELALALDLDATDLLQVTLQFDTPQLAVGLFGVLEAQFTQAKEQAPMVRQMLTADATGKGFLPYFEQLLAETKLANDASTITLSVPKLKDLEKLPELLKPAVEEVARAAQIAERMNNLKMIGLAFANYESANGRFPALNGPANKDQPHPGLSWRVYLLPSLDEDALYRQFKLDEPWDSAHNKPLIAKMPKLFGKNAEGKTSIHVFTGKGAPFQDGAAIRISDVTDGTSNTILAVEAGEDVADIWTKPGGLVFDPETPLKCLGEIKEFNALLMDFSVRRLKNIDPAVFSKLVQHQDGMPVTIE